RRQCRSSGAGEAAAAQRRECGRAGQRGQPQGGRRAERQRHVTDEAIPAATLILVRERPVGPPDLLMVERAEGMAFAAGALVFPGGRIDDADRQFAATLGLEDGAAVAAIRETLEETAVPIGLAPLPHREQAARLQQELTAEGD